MERGARRYADATALPGTGDADGTEWVSPTRPAEDHARHRSCSPQPLWRRARLAGAAVLHARRRESWRANSRRDAFGSSAAGSIIRHEASAQGRESSAALGDSETAAHRW